MRKYPVVKNRRTFHTMGLSSGYQRLPPWHQKTLTRDIMAEKKIKQSDHEDKITDEKQQNTATKNANTRQKNVLISVTNKSNSEDKKGHRKQQIKLDGAKHKRRQQQKSIVSLIIKRC